MKTGKGTQVNFMGSKLKVAFDNLGAVGLAKAMREVSVQYFQFTSSYLVKLFPEYNANFMHSSITPAASAYVPSFGKNLDKEHYHMLKVASEIRTSTMAQFLKEKDKWRIPVSNYVHNILNSIGATSRFAGFVLVPDYNKTQVYATEVHEYGPSYKKNKTSFAYYLNELFDSGTVEEKEEIIRCLEFCFIAQQIFFITFGFYPKFLRDLALYLYGSDISKVKMDDLKDEYLFKLDTHFRVVASGSSYSFMTVLEMMQVEYIERAEAMQLVTWSKDESQRITNVDEPTEEPTQDEKVPEETIVEEVAPDEVIDKKDEKTSDEHQETQQDPYIEERLKEIRKTYDEVIKKEPKKSKHSTTKKVIVGALGIAAAVGVGFLIAKCFSKEDGPEILDTGDLPFSLDDGLDFI